MGSNPPLLVLSSVSFLLLVVFAYLKNRVLSTSEPGRCPGKKGSVMGKTENFVLIVLGSVSEVVVALGASLLASVGPLSQANFAPNKERLAFLIQRTCSVYRRGS